MQATDKEFFDHEINNGISPHNPEYLNLMLATSDIVVKYANDIIEIGSGLGTLGECLIKKGCNYYGIEPNKYHRDFALDRGVQLNDLDNYPKLCEMIVSIEVFEHLTDNQIDEYLKSIQATYFLFSSTPHKTTEEFDTWWGHINLKSEEEWITLFSKYGYKVHEKLSIPTTWSLLFKKDGTTK
jgi:2-polyprenyl-3-methyl-5-hydroxy-6-metoxy-1,4-benzoquinol methylase